MIVVTCIFCTSLSSAPLLNYTNNKTSKQKLKRTKCIEQLLKISIIVDVLYLEWSSVI